MKQLAAEEYRGKGSRSSAVNIKRRGA